MSEHLQTVLYRIRHGGSGSALERARWALAQLSRYMPNTEGYVYLLKEDGAERVAALLEEPKPESEGERAPPPLDPALVRLDAWVSQRLLARAATLTMTACTQDLAALMTINQIELAGVTYRLLFLDAHERDEEGTVGALLVPAELAEAIPESVLEAVASRLRTLTTARVTVPPTGSPSAPPSATTSAPAALEQSDDRRLA